jgi:surface antigen
MLKKSALVMSAAVLAFCAGTSAALADDCRSDRTGGTVLGAIAGGVLGGVASHGNGAAIAGGAIFGGLAGNAIARDNIDCEDRDYAGRAYEEAFDGDVGQRYEWTGRHGGHGYIVVNDVYRRDGHRCVDFTQVVWHHDDRFERNGTACHYDGDWHFQDQ